MCIDTEVCGYDAFSMKTLLRIAVGSLGLLVTISCSEFQSAPVDVPGTQEDRERRIGDFPTDGFLLVGTTEPVTLPSGGGYLRNFVYSSEDGGASWQQIERPDNQFSRGPLTMMSVKNNELMLGNYIGISRLAGFGQDWEFMLLGGRDDQRGSVYDYFEDNNLMLAATSDLVKRSVDDGTNWQSFSQQEMGGGYTKTAYQIERRGDKIFVATKYDIIVSNDNGATWSRILYAGNLSNRSDYDPQFVFAGDAMFVSSSTLGLFRSDDEGVTWIQVPLPDISPWNDWIKQIQYDGQFLFGVGPLGIYRSQNLGATWTWIPSYRITGADTSIVRLSASEGVLMAMTYDYEAKTSDISVSGDSGATWRSVRNSPGFPSDQNVLRVLVPAAE